MLGIFLPSGGLRYHLRSRRYRSLWQPFRDEIQDWLETWNCDFDELVLLGPSAAYTLPTPWLKKFKTIYAYDLDPLAPLMFRWQHGSLNIGFRRKNLFWENGNLSTQPLREVLNSHPKANLLFANVLGQVLLEGRADEEEWRRFLGQLRRILRFRNWGSYHDLFTHQDGCVIDHLTQGDWTKGLDARQFNWQLTPESRHIIEGVFNSGGST